MSFAINTVYLSGDVINYTQPEIVELSSGSSFKKVTILISYIDINNGKPYKIPVEINTGDLKMELIMKKLTQGTFISIDGRLVSSQYMNKSTGKEVTFLRVDPYVIYFPKLGECVMLKSRTTGNPMTNYQGVSPRAQMTAEEAKQRIQQTTDSMKSAQPTQMPPKYTPPINSEELMEDTVPF